MYNLKYHVGCKRINESFKINHLYEFDINNLYERFSCDNVT